MKGKFRPKNPQKYKGDPTTIIFRSSWEFKVMSKLDLSDNVDTWSSEEIIIPYKDPFTSKKRRYFPDFWVKYKDGTQEIIEVKPEYQVKGPSVQKNTTKKYIKEVITYGNNSAKWEAAEKFCKKHGYKWTILTENDLGIKKRGK